MAIIECSECGKEISDKSRSCIHCGNPIERKIKCKECGKEYNINNKICPHCGYKINKTNEKIKENKNKVKNSDNYRANIIICFLVPIIGIIMFCINRNEKPKEALHYLIASFILPILVSIIAVFCILCAPSAPSNIRGKYYITDYDENEEEYIKLNWNSYERNVVFDDTEEDEDYDENEHLSDSATFTGEYSYDENTHILTLYSELGSEYDDIYLVDERSATICNVYDNDYDYDYDSCIYTYKKQ